MGKNNLNIIDSSLRLIATEEKLKVFKAAVAALEKGSRNFDIFEYLEIFRLTVFLAWIHAVTGREIDRMLSLLLKNILKYGLPYAPLVTAEIQIEKEIVTEVELAEFLEKYAECKEALISYLEWRLKNEK